MRAAAARLSRLCVRAAGASPALRTRSFFSLGFLSGGDRVPLIFELPSGDLHSVQAKVRKG
jgi:hypothetical protein